jgi:hypothetical protein
MTMNIKLRDRLRFALLFFRSLSSDTDSLRVDVCRTEDNNYLMAVDQDIMDAGFSDQMYG